MDIYAKLTPFKNGGTLPKNEIFNILSDECTNIPPGATLSYKLRNRLEKFSVKERREIVSMTLNGNAPLFIACQRGNVDVVEYLITVCNADIEQKGLYKSANQGSLHYASPLWCAAVSGKLPVVKSLVNHGADINSISDTGSTPVRSACFMSFFSIVRYLVENGADISKPNYNGGTCLINSVQSDELCEYLINHGADVNAQDIQHKTALHYAIQEHRFETTRLLLKYKADPFIKSKYNDDALQTAGLKGAVDIFNCILQYADFPPERIAETYEILGTTFLVDHYDMEFTVYFWKKALNLRTENNLPKTLPIPCKTFQYATEFQTTEDLDLIIYDQDALKTQSLLICQRILGSNHKDMIMRLLYQGAEYGDTRQYQKCINLWLYALELRIKNDTIMYTDTCSTAQALINLYIEVLFKFKEDQIPGLFQYEAILHTMEMISSEIPSASQLVKIHPVYKRHQNNFDAILRIFTHLLYIILDVTSTPDQLVRVSSIVKKIIQLDPRTVTDGYSLLHLSVLKSNALYNESLLEVSNSISLFPCLQVVKFLAECGANVNCITMEKGYSVLHLACQSKNFDRKVVRFLIDSGAHLDQAAFDRTNPSQLLSSSSSYWHGDIISKTSLKCLAAKCIRDHSLAFKGEIPSHLEPFVLMH